MGVLLDTRAVRAADRAAALHTAFLETSGATQVDLRHEGSSPWGLITLSPIGEAAVFSAACDGVRLVRDARAASTGFDDIVAIAVHGTGTARHATTDGQRLVRAGELMMVDLTRPFEFAWDGHGSSSALQLPRALLGLSVDDVHRAGGRLTQSPLYDLVRGHLRWLTQSAEPIDGSQVSSLVASSTALLIRALLTDVSGREKDRDDVTEDTLVAQVREYIRVHLHEPDLGPDRIASALAVSRRQLFRVCRTAELSIEQHIIDLRLRGARSQLADPTRAATVASVAANWGFKDADHFTRRFRSEFGVSPGVWRRMHSGER
jgi:AraC-like DNA-binding protein